ncbi:hypothetical protein [Mesonia sp. K4-1]|uniref:hypothetical protein n=1 Tax=Mesonia sp. K4-1 TaxID=2602760 RepID=UPI0011CB17F9|nr:hypothetical protein [Mesonia sp. K4-1]TXK76236.1 hypothetical protein FT986_07365 [Mesonia sp. K4-1]
MNVDFPITWVTNQKLPYPPEFICYEDDDIKVYSRITFSNETLVERIDFSCENKNETQFEIADIKFCGNKKNLNHPSTYNFRVLLINDGHQNSNYILEGNELGHLNLELNAKAYFSFNVIDSSQVNEFKDNCNFNSDKPRSKDGYIIITIR